MILEPRSTEPEESPNVSWFYAGDRVAFPGDPDDLGTVVEDMKGRQAVIWDRPQAPDDPPDVDDLDRKTGNFAGGALGECDRPVLLWHGGPRTRRLRALRAVLRLDVALRAEGA